MILSTREAMKDIRRPGAKAVLRDLAAVEEDLAHHGTNIDAEELHDLITAWAFKYDVQPSSIYPHLREEEER